MVSASASICWRDSQQIFATSGTCPKISQYTICQADFSVLGLRVSEFVRPFKRGFLVSYPPVFSSPGCKPHWFSVPHVMEPFLTGAGHLGWGTQCGCQTLALQVGPPQLWLPSCLRYTAPLPVLPCRCVFPLHPQSHWVCSASLQIILKGRCSICSCFGCFCCSRGGSFYSAILTPFWKKQTIYDRECVTPMQREYFSFHLLILPTGVQLFLRMLR